MKRLLWPLFLLFVSSLSAQTTYTVETVPNPKDTGNGYVSDPDDIISAMDETVLNRIIGDLEDSSTAQIAVVVVNSIGQEVPKDFATRLFNHWGIGQADVDNGLLIFTVMDQRRTEFETGYGMEAVLPDVICYRIGMQELVPHFREGNYGDGLIAAVQRIRDILETPEALQDIQSELDEIAYSRPKTGWYAIPAFWRWYIIITAAFTLFVLVWTLITLAGKQDLYDKYRELRYVYGIWFIVLFPLPYLIIYFILRRVRRNLRNKPRYSRVTGELMHKLTEIEDDSFLEAGQITEEGIGSVDYDVWVTESGDDMLILPYAKLFSKYQKCPKCGYKTYYHAHSKVIRHATYTSSGKRELTYKCKNCHFVETKYQTIPKKQRSSSSSGGGSSGGGSWGGGSSGGGGSGVSW